MVGKRSQVYLRRVHSIPWSHLVDVMSICEWLLTLLRWPVSDELMSFRIRAFYIFLEM